MFHRDYQRRSRRGVLALAVVTALPVCLQSVAKADPINWIAGSGSWEVGNNWQFGFAPSQQTDDGVIVNNDNISRTIIYDASQNNQIDSITLSNHGAGINTLSQTGGSLQTDYQIIGDNGKGAYSLTGGNNFVQSFNPGTAGLILGNSLGGAGTYTVGTNTLLQVQTASAVPGEVIGNAGAGTLIQSGGINILMASGTLLVGSQSTGTGYYELDSGAQLSGSQGEVIGEAGTGTFNQMGGNNFVGGGLTVGDGSLGTGTYLLTSGGTLTVIGSSTIGYLNVGNSGTGNFVMSGGVLQVGSATTGELIVGAGTGRGTFTLNGAGTVNVAGLLGVAKNGTLTQSAGTINVTTGFAYVGDAGTGTMNENGGVLNTPLLLIASIDSGGTGIFNHNTGTVSAGELDIGQVGAGTYTLASGGTLNVGDMTNLYAGGTFIISGGTASTGNPATGIADGLVDTGLVTRGFTSMSSGTLNVTGIDLVTTNGTFIQNGGLHSVRGLMVIGSSAIFGDTPTASDLYQLNAGTLLETSAVFPLASGSGTANFGSLLISAGGTLSATANGYLVADAHLGGGVVSGVLHNQGTFSFDSGTFNAQLINDGTFELQGNTLGGSVTNNATGIFDGAGTVTGAMTNNGTINPNGNLVVTQSLSNSGIINLGTGSVISGAGTITNQFGGVINYAGLITNPLTNQGGVINASVTLPVNQAILNSGSINLTNGINGTGSIQNNTGGVIAGAGTIKIPITQSGGFIEANNPNLPLGITSTITISGSNSQLIVAPGCTMSLALPLSNSAVIALQGPTSLLSGSQITNTGTIKGVGQIANTIQNTGTIRAAAGELDLAGLNNTNTSAGQIITDANTVNFLSGLSSNGGLIALGGGVFDNSGVAITNTGNITGHGTFRGGAISNSGSMNLSGATSDVDAAVTNTGKITVTGNSVTTFWNSVNNSAGSLTVNLGSSAVFLGPVTGMSRISGAGVKDFESTASAGAIDTVTGTTIVGASAVLTTDSIRDNTLSVVGRASINANGTITGTSRVNSLLIDGTTNSWNGKLDLANNNLIVDYTGASPIQTIENQLHSAYANGPWTGLGLTSSNAAAASTSSHKTALGYAEASALNLSSFGGDAIDNSTVVTRYTYFGDANLDGIVNALDFNALATNYGKTPGNDVWTQGDFNYDRSVNSSDFDALAANFGEVTASSTDVPDAQLPLAAQSLGLTLPEPSSLILLAISGAAMRLTSRRTRRKLH